MTDHGDSETRRGGDRGSAIRDRLAPEPRHPAPGTRPPVLSSSVPLRLCCEEKTMKKKRHPLPLVAPKHRMIVAADVWLKRRKKEGKEK